MSKVTFCQGQILLTSCKQTTVHSFNGNLNFTAGGVQTSNAKKTNYIGYNSLQVNTKTYKLNHLILRGKRRKGLDTDNKPHNDLKYRDYQENNIGFEKLYNEIYWENITNGNTKTSKNNSNYSPYEQAVAHARANKVVRKIKNFCKKNSKELFDGFYSNVEYYAKGELEDVIHLMVKKMKTNKSNSDNFSDSRLNKAVKEHQNQINFKNNIINILKDELQYEKSIHSAIQQLQIKDNGEGKLYQKLLKNKVDSPKFPDKFSGLGIIMNDVWAYEIYVKELKTTKYQWLPNMTSNRIKLDFVYYDHFGLDYPDLEKKRAPSPLIAWDHDVFWEWFVLQHFRGYVPFITKVINTYEFDLISYNQ